MFSSTDIYLAEKLYFNKTSSLFYKGGARHQFIYHEQQGKRSYSTSPK